MARLKKLGKQRRVLLETKTELEMKGKTLSAERGTQPAARPSSNIDLGSLEQILRRYETRPWEKQAKDEQQPPGPGQALPAGRVPGGDRPGLGAQRAV